MSSDHPGGPGRIPDYNAQFGRMNINASAFVPNVQAPAFIPGGGHGIPPGYPPQYGSGYPMPGHHPHMYGGHPGMYNIPPNMMPPSGGYMMHRPMQGSHFGVQTSHPSPNTVPRVGMTDQRQPPQHKPEPIPSPHQTTPTHNIEAPPTKPSPPEPKTVDSWEDIAVDEQTTYPPKTSANVTSAEEDSSIPDRSSPQEVNIESSSKNSEEVKPKVTNTNATSSPKPKPLKVETSKVAAGVQVTPKAADEKENINIIFIGHVDAGKSTIGGHVMYLTGQVDKRTLEKYEREAKEKNRETWYLSWALDTNQEERDKGKTVEVGRASFETEKKRFTILDAPGHAGFVPNMISGAAQADIGVLVISARKGEFETGFERKGQTREHAMLAKTAGVKHLVVLINKMDDPTVKWAEERYEECKNKLTPFLKKVGFNPKTDIFYIPVSGLTGANLKDSASDSACSWYSGPPFIPYLNNLPPIVREDKGPFRMPIADKYKDMGTVVMGKVESGGVTKGSVFLLMPNRASVEVLSVLRVDEEVVTAYSGDNIKLRLKGIEEEDISPGFVLCDPTSPCHVGNKFEAQIAVLEHKSIICAGYSAVLHIHSVVEEVQLIQLKALIDRKTGKRAPHKPRFVKQDQVVLAVLQTAGVICLETFKEFPQMARFTLRDEGKTIAIGKVLKLLD